MTKSTTQAGLPSSPRSNSLRQKAEDWLSGYVPMPEERGWETSVEALSILYRLANNAASSGEALKLLHELQVHQVELALQREELEKAHLELIARTRIDPERFAFAPVGHLTTRADVTLIDLDAAAARLLGMDAALLLGRRLDSLLAADSRERTRDLLTRLARLGPAITPPAPGGVPAAHCTSALAVVRQAGDKPLQLLAKASSHAGEIDIALLDPVEWMMA